MIQVKVQTSEPVSVDVQASGGGIPGAPGRDGRDGKDGRDGRDAYSPFLNEETGTWFAFDDDGQMYIDTGIAARGPAGESGKDGRDGSDGQPGRDGVDGAPGRDGRDGRDADPLTVDATLSHSGEAADAKAVGDALSAIRDKMAEGVSFSSLGEEFLRDLTGYMKEHLFGEDEPDTPEEPDEPLDIPYQMVTALISPEGTAPYIMTDLTGLDVTKLSANVKGSVKGTQGSGALLGSRESTTAATRYELCSFEGMTIWRLYCMSPAFAGGSMFPNDGETHVFCMDGGSLSIDEGEAVSASSVKGSLKYPLFLFATNTADTTVSNTAGVRTIYSAKFFYEGVLIAQFIPVLDADGTPCMYETVGGRLYYSANDAAFDYIA